MRILLDTNGLFWWFNAPDRLSNRALSMLSKSENEVTVSAASGWELAIKVKLGKIDALSLVSSLPDQLDEEGFAELPVSMKQAVRAGLLPLHHRDPFDRLLVAQAQDLNIPILSPDPILDRYDVTRLW